MHRDKKHYTQDDKRRRNIKQQNIQRIKSNTRERVGGRNTKRTCRQKDSEQRSTRNKTDNTGEEKRRRIIRQNTERMGKKQERGKRNTKRR